MFELNTIYNEDCLDLLEDIEDDSIDCIITDPPYNIANSSKLTMVGENYVSTSTAWGTAFEDSMEDSEYILFLSILAEHFFRVLKPGGSLLLFFDRGHPHFLSRFYQLFDFKNMIVFIKLNSLPYIRKNNYRSGFEQCAWFSKGKPKTFHFLDQVEMNNVFYGNIGKKVTTHPTEKYEWQINPLIERHTDPDDIILDPFIGSGSVGEFALKYQRNFIGMELNTDFYTMATRRITNCKQNLTLSLF